MERVKKKNVTGYLKFLPFFAALQGCATRQYSSGCYSWKQGG